MGLQIQSKNLFLLDKALQGCRVVFSHYDDPLCWLLSKEMLSFVQKRVERVVTMLDSADFYVGTEIWVFQQGERVEPAKNLNRTGR